MPGLTLGDTSIDHSEDNGRAADGAEPFAAPWSLHEIKLAVVVQVTGAQFEKAINLFATRLMKDVIAASEQTHIFLTHFRVHTKEWAIDDFQQNRAIFFNAVKSAAVSKQPSFIDLLYLDSPPGITVHKRGGRPSESRGMGRSGGMGGSMGGGMGGSRSSMGVGGSSASGGVGFGEIEGGRAKHDTRRNVLCKVRLVYNFCYIDPGEVR